MPRGLPPLSWKPTASLVWASPCSNQRRVHRFIAPLLARVVLRSVNSARPPAEMSPRVAGKYIYIAIMEGCLQLQ